MDKSLDTGNMLANNPTAHFSYTILDTIEAGLVLTGAEVKSVRAGRVSLKESFAKLKNGEFWLANAHISPYQNSPAKGYNPTRPRKLLLSKKEIDHLIGKFKEQGLSLVPLNIHLKHSRIKVELGLGRGKKKYDKRATIKEREAKRIQQRAVRQKK
ncbi:MAG: SsrA-binding protein SmpB [bacterium]